MPIVLLILGLACAFAAPPVVAQENTPQQVYITLSPLQAPIMRAGKMYRQVRLRLQIETLPGAHERQTREMLPRLQTVFQSTLLDIAGSRLRPRKAPDIAFIADRMQAEADRILGPDIARVRIDNVSIIR